MIGTPRDFTGRLQRWYDAHRRDLPWRSPLDRSELQALNPYHVLVSELMLQQTQVATVIPYFLRFIEKFPTVALLAAADEQQVLRAWQGLGYYARRAISSPPPDRSSRRSVAISHLRSTNWLHCPASVGIPPARWRLLHLRGAPRSSTETWRVFYVGLMQSNPIRANRLRAKNSGKEPRKFCRARGWGILIPR